MVEEHFTNMVVCVRVIREIGVHLGIRLSTKHLVLNIQVHLTGEEEP